MSVIYTKGKNDECYTPANAVDAILEYIPKGSVVWCPFDKQDSNFVRVLRENGFMVVLSHIGTGQDFYDYEPEMWDVMISNPPFTNKRQIFERALSFGKPIALLMSNTWLNDKYSKWVFYESGRGMQLLMFDKRIEFGNQEVSGKITFSSSYFCSDFLPRDIILKELKTD